MSLLTLEAKLERTDKSTPWGFRMQGGKDYASPLTIQRVTPGSLAAKCGLQAGDIILKIGNAGAEHLRHKEAQDIIVSCPNKLDLLLQRGGSGIQPVYDKFPVSPLGGPSASPAGGFQTSLNFNAAPKPFGSPAPAPAAPSYGAPSGPSYGAPPPPPPPVAPSYSGSNIGNLSQQTQNMSLSGDAPDYMQSAKKYTEREAAPDPSQTQSRSFKFLQGLMDSGQEPPSSAMAGGTGGPPPPGGTPSQPGTVKAIMSQRYNNPIGLYSETNVERELEGQSKFLIKDGTGAGDVTANSGVMGNNSTSNQNNSQPGAHVYYPSETYKLVQERENQVEKEDERYQPAQSRSLKILQEQLQSGGGVTPGQAAGGAKPATWTPKPAPAPAPAPISAAPASKPWAPSPAAPPPPSMGGPRPGGGMSGVKGPAQRGKKGDAVMRQQGATGADIPRVATCAQCGNTIRGPFVVALSKTWCPDHFTCANPRCGIKLIDIGFVEEAGNLYCERDYEQFFAPRCEKCKAAIVGECVNALTKSYHPQCFLCFHCKQPIGGNQFHIEDGHSYCEKDWNAMFQTMCSGCSFPIEPGDKWVEAMSKNFHSECFNCATCQVSLEGAPFYVKAGKPFCKKHVR